MPEAVRPCLEIDNISVVFGGLRAVSDLSFNVDCGQIVGLIGPNGAGKTTVFNAILGVFPPAMARFGWTASASTGCQTHQITRLGLGRTFQNIRLFKTMSVPTTSRWRCSGTFPTRCSRACCDCRAAARRNARSPAAPTRCWSCSSCAMWPARKPAITALRAAEVPRNRPSLCQLDPLSVARRAGGGAERQRDARADAQDPPGRGRDGRRRAADRARHAPRDEPLRAHRSDRLRRKISEGSAEHVRNDPRVIEAYLGTQEAEL
jgi:energy-coupling factor transporter ATP-binding protein EcfA2